MMKYTLIRFSGIALFLIALGCAGPVRAQTEGRLKFCTDHDYTYYVRNLLLEISPSDGVPVDFDLAIELDGQARTIPVKRKAGDTDGWWRGEAPVGFKLEKIGLQPKIPGFTVSEPESCQYQVVQVKDVKVCAAWYRFRVHQVKLTLQTDPPEAAVRLTPSAGPIRNSDARCAFTGSGSRQPADAQLAARVQAALEQDEALYAFIIEVRAQGGSVYLSGLVNSESAKQKATAKAKVAGASIVVNNLQVQPLYDGTALMDVDKLAGGTVMTVTIERVKAGELLFTATVEVPADFLRNSEWTVSRELLQRASARPFAASAATQHGRNAVLLQSALNKLGDIKSIKIKRSAW
jgi:hypothetical protein